MNMKIAVFGMWHRLVCYPNTNIKKESACILITEYRNAQFSEVKFNVFYWHCSFKTFYLATAITAGATEVSIMGWNSVYDRNVVYKSVP
jgi:hypothetical protein